MQGSPCVTTANPINDICNCATGCYPAWLQAQIWSPKVHEGTCSVSNWLAPVVVQVPIGGMCVHGICREICPRRRFKPSDMHEPHGPASIRYPSLSLKRWSVVFRTYCFQTNASLCRFSGLYYIALLRSLSLIFN
jgi:hypothetical protein